MIWRMSMRVGGSGKMPPLRLVMLCAALAIGIPVAVGASPAAADACRVQISEVLVQPYGNGHLKLEIRGTHNFSSATKTGGRESTRFAVVDNDGIFSLAVFSARWRDAGGASVASDPVSGRATRAEVESLKRAMEMGIAYYERGLATVALARPDNLAELLRIMNSKLAIQRQTLWLLNNASDYRQSDDTVAVGSLEWINLQLTRFRFDEGRDVASQYRDLAVADGGAQVFCSDRASSAIIGRLACPPPASGANAGRLDDGICPEGLTFSPLLIPPPPP